MVDDRETMIQIDNVSKEYRLGEIGGTTLTETFQRLFAKIRHKEDPTKKIGAKNYNKGDKFLALDGINLTIKKGERVGIIGHNGAGKSTLLKLICRVTAPSSGEIGLNGRITSMLEVGTGFHPELTGRENIYMNGAILGMTKKEIDGIIEDIIEFSEVREFIDTPVKRYSSGMYVKLAFSVAAHLKSEIMIMDEVLAVGDMQFQNKCLSKMRSVSEEDGRTILYVSHNMNTIRQLCDRVVVLDHGCIIFDGGVGKGVRKYLEANENNDNVTMDLSAISRGSPTTDNIHLNKVSFGSETNNFEFGSSIKMSLYFKCNKAINDLIFRINIYTTDGKAVATMHTCRLSSIKASNRGYCCQFRINLSSLAPDSYFLKIIAFEPTIFGKQIRHDVVNKAIFFNIVDSGKLHNLEWDSLYWGNVILPEAEINIYEE